MVDNKFIVGSIRCNTGVFVITDYDIHSLGVSGRWVIILVFVDLEIHHSLLTCIPDTST